MSLQVPLEGVERVMTTTTQDIATLSTQLHRLCDTTKELARFNANFSVFLSSLQQSAALRAYPDVDLVAETRATAARDAALARKAAAEARLNEASAAAALLRAASMEEEAARTGTRGVRGAAGVAQTALPAIAAHFDLTKLPPKFQTSKDNRDALFRLYEGILSASAPPSSASGKPAGAAAKAAAKPGTAAGAGAGADNVGVTLATAVGLTRGTTIFTNECLSLLQRLSMVERVQAAADKRGRGVTFRFIAVAKPGPVGGARAGKAKAAPGTAKKAAAGKTAEAAGTRASTRTSSR